MKRGTALLWTVVALMVVTITLTVATTTFLQLARLQRRSRERLLALACGQRTLERIRSGAGSDGDSTVEGLPGGRLRVALSADKNSRLRQVVVMVSWRDPEGERRMHWTTLVQR